MKILEKMLKQKAVYWEPKDRTNRDGEKQFELPVEIKCRWEDGVDEDLQFDEKEEKPEATVYSDRDLKAGGLLLEGLIEDLEKPLPPPSTAERIKKIRKTPTLKATKYLRENFV